MSDIERVKEMVAGGQITAEEGDQLIKVLREVDAADDAAIDAAYEADIAAADRVEMLAAQAEETDAGEVAPANTGAAAGDSDVIGGVMRTAATAVDAAMDAAADMGREAGRIARQAAHQTARDMRESARAARDAAREAARGAREAARGAREAAREMRRADAGSGASLSGSRPGAAIAPTGTKWVTIEMVSGDLDVWAVDGLTGPEVEGGPGNINVEDSADGYTVRFSPGGGSGGLIDKFLSHTRSGDLRVRIPSDHGVVVKATAGDVDLHGVRYLRGKLTAGDLSADALEGIDFSSMAGDLDVTLLVRHGNHALTVGAGDVEVTLDDRSDVSVDAVVSIGEVDSSEQSFSRVRRTVGGELTGVLGSGEARLSLRATTGDIDVRVRRTQAGGSDAEGSARG